MHVSMLPIESSVSADNTKRGKMAAYDGINKSTCHMICDICEDIQIYLLHNTLLLI